MRARPEAWAVARWWHAWTTDDHADEFEELLRKTIFPRLRRIAGFRGGYVLRRPAGASEVEFATLTVFESLDVIRSFAGDDAEAAVLFPEARPFVARYDERAEHFEIRLDRPGQWAQLAPRAIRCFIKLRGGFLNGTGR